MLAAIRKAKKDTVNPQRTACVFFYNSEIRPNVLRGFEKKTRVGFFVLRRESVRTIMLKRLSSKAYLELA